MDLRWILLIIITTTLTISGCTQHSGKITDVDYETEKKNFFHNTQKQMFDQPIITDHLCVNLSHKEVQDLQLGLIYSAPTLPNTCNQQTIIVSGAHDAYLHIDFYESKQGAEQRINRLEKSVSSSVANSPNLSRPGQSTNTSYADALRWKNQEILRFVSSRIHHFSQSTQPQNIHDCTLVTRIPAGFIMTSYSVAGENHEFSSPGCQIAAYALGTLLDNHTHKDANSPQFCFSFDESWLAKHKIFPSKESKGCQDQILTWNNTVTLKTHKKQVSPDLVTIQLGKGYFWPIGEHLMDLSGHTVYFSSIMQQISLQQSLSVCSANTHILRSINLIASIQSSTTQTKHLCSIVAELINYQLKHHFDH